MEGTITTVPSFSHRDRRVNFDEETFGLLNTDRMVFQFENEAGETKTGVVTGVFGTSLPFTQGVGEKVHLDDELTGYWNDENPNLLEIGWDEPPDQFPRCLGITPEQLAGEMAAKASRAADLAHQATIGFDDLPEGDARRLLRLMAHHLSDLANDAEAIS